MDLKFKEKIAKQLINKGYIKKAEDEETIEQKVDELIKNNDHRNLFYLLRDKKITKENNSKLFYKIVNYLLNNVDGLNNRCSDLIISEIITKKDKELFYKALENINFDAIRLFEYGIIDRNDFNKMKKHVIEFILRSDYPGLIDDLFDNKLITEEDGELFNRLIKYILERNYMSGYKLIKSKIVTRKNPESFKQCVLSDINNGKGSALLKNKLVTEEDGELYTKLKDSVNKKDKNKNKSLGKYIVIIDLDQLGENADQGQWELQNDGSFGTGPRQGGAYFKEDIEDNLMIFNSESEAQNYIDKMDLSKDFEEYDKDEILDTISILELNDAIKSNNIWIYDEDEE